MRALYVCVSISPVYELIRHVCLSPRSGDCCFVGGRDYVALWCLVVMLKSRWGLDGDLLGLD